MDARDRYTECNVLISDIRRNLQLLYHSVKLASNNRRSTCASAISNNYVLLLIIASKEMYIYIYNNNVYDRCRHIVHICVGIGDT